MILYGITISSPENNFVVTQTNGVRVYRDTLTRVFPTQKEAIKFALSKVKNCFDSFRFEGQPAYRMDCNGIPLKEHKAELEEGHDTCIQGKKGHISFEFFTQNVDVSDVPEEEPKEKRGRPKKGERLFVNTPVGRICVEAVGKKDDCPGVRITTHIGVHEELVASVEWDSIAERYLVRDYNYGDKTAWLTYEPETGDRI